MQHNTGYQQLQQWLRQWRLQGLLHNILLSLAAALLISTIIHILFHGSFVWAVPVFILTLFISMLLFPFWKLSITDVTQYLNRQEPALEESTQLLLPSATPFTTLEQLQLSRIQPALLQLRPSSPIKASLKKTALYSIAAVALSIGLIILDKPGRQQNDTDTTSNPSGKSVPEKLLPGIQKASLQIQPPAYTRKALRTQNALNVLTEEGAQLQWLFQTNQPVTQLQLLFNDSSRIQCTPVNAEHTQWKATTLINKPGFYQVQLQQQLSEFYKIEVIKDQPPVIAIQLPELHTVIDFGMPQRVPLRVRVADDYGVAGTDIVATIASGSGEAVKFKEQQIAFNADFRNHDTAYNLQHSLDLAAMQMKPGDELYFYIKSEDTHGQQSRSDMYIVTLPDTTQLMSMDGIVNSLDVKPELFRSERQIIIETELLLRSQTTLSQQEFTKKSDDLGVDQKLLRLRYGKFLGEESETHIGDERVDGDDDHGSHAATAQDAKDFNNAEKILDAYSHKHDIAEDATFFDPETKKQLKATLSEMWNAELKLRTHKPQEALPFEYKALRLLKDLQQKSRSFVGKTSTKIPPLKPEKRLTGEQDKIISPTIQKEAVAAADNQQSLRSVIGILEQLKTGNAISATGNSLLQQAMQQLGKAASAQPAAYLTAYESIQRIMQAVKQNNSSNTTDIAVTEKAIRRLLTPPVKLPAAAAPSTAPGLSQQYFQQLKSPHQP